MSAAGAAATSVAWGVGFAAGALGAWAFHGIRYGHHGGHGSINVNNSANFNFNNNGNINRGNVGSGNRWNAGHTPNRRPSSRPGSTRPKQRGANTRPKGGARPGKGGVKPGGARPGSKPGGRPGSRPGGKPGGSRPGKAPAKPANPDSRHIPRATRDEVMIRDGHQCAFVGKNGKRCTCKHNLQIDHVRPWALGGTHDPRNLRVLCAAHNRHLARKLFGDGAVPPAGVA